MSNKSPLVSICIPAYNHENYIVDAIQSVINQTYKNIELIIIDNNSPDKTWNKIQKILSKCEKRFARVVAEINPIPGICASLNRGLKIATGEYIGFLASDDIYKPELVETLVEFLSHNPEYVLAVGDNEIIDTNGKICFWDEHRNCVYDETNAIYKTFTDFLKKERPDVNSDTFGKYATLCKGNYIPNGYLIKRDLFNVVGLFPLDIKAEDWYMHLQLSKHGKYKYLDKVLFQYRWHDNNTIKNTSVMNANINIVLNHELNIVKNMPEYLNLFDKHSGHHKTILQITKWFRLYKTPCRIVWGVGKKEFTVKANNTVIYR